MAIRAELQLGEDHLDYGAFASGSLSPDSAWAISVGADKNSPSTRFKGDPDTPNEDGLLVVEDGDRTLLAVADAHFGRAPSHVLLRDLAARADPLPTTLEALTDLVATLAARPPESGLRAGTSFLVAVYHRSTGQGFGLSYWDSSFALVGPRGHRSPLVDRSAGIVYLADPATLHPREADLFIFTTEPGDLLLAYTDGIDCCHYNHPATSVTPAEMDRLFRAGSKEPLAFLERLVPRALAGVDGHPGGEDNLAVVAVRA